ncbi:uncharacterized protein BP01DRAFT_332855 [Aspergillus saccharolyticus JOP 1030-1]|uniref:Uncharacterized protein n=1 Tax=Aspergillus saccharolyticus JOP 1030-1 TaxID=1450539 RepID=A0A319AB07_9EURO|nr:hypothetical protein BP01DRAFT_332855 [Aspergillus saccharolyticus JOP 1030-1]PYH48828.1 hypothetical protein BP01DRAFT_332855 [Aspergillus saccharolyticus JOP 1030-1]
MSLHIPSTLTHLLRHSARALSRSDVPHEHENARPHSSLFEESSSQQRDKEDFPMISECAIHLELLEAFQSLRGRVTTSKKLTKVLGRMIGCSRYSILHGRIDASQIWHQFLSLAVTRFQHWIQAVDHRLEVKHTEEKDEPCLLPPLDILMVWHAFLLNPYDFARFCSTNHLSHIRAISFPWKAIHQALSQDTWSYTLPSSAATWLRNGLSIAPDLITALQGNEITNASAATTITPPEHSPLIDNVLRQAVFIDKMHDFLWIRSPALQGTLARALTRYERFINLFRLQPGTILVPTLDVDLVWHTHLCSATTYEESMLERTGRYINHDDKLEEGVLSDGFDTTGRLYEAATGESYGGCFCWNCEAMRSAKEEAGGEIDADLRRKIELEVDCYWQAEIRRRK